MSDDDLRAKLKPYLLNKGQDEDPIVDEFLQRVYYRSGRNHRWCGNTVFTEFSAIET